jgi:hypothetical protein
MRKRARQKSPSHRWQGRTRRVSGVVSSGQESSQEQGAGAQSPGFILMVPCCLPGSTLQSLICSNDALFYFVFFYPFPIFGILIITILLVRFKSRNSSKNSEGKNGVPLLWIKEPHLNYSPTCLEPPVLSIHPGAID